MFFCIMLACCFFMVHYAPVNGLEIKAITFNGFKPEQQDRYVTCKNHNEIFVAGIFDGHGDYGAKVAEALKTIAPGILNSCSVLTDSSIENAFHNIATMLEKKLGSNMLAVSGSTAVVVLQDTDYFYIAHCGDARAVWGFQKNDQTIDHTPKNEKEYLRIDYRNIYNMKVGGMLAVSRAFGDLALKVNNLTHIPTITKIKKSDFPTLLLGCDGVFDYASTKNNEKDAQTFNNKELWTIVQTNLEKLDFGMLQLAAQIILSDEFFKKAKRGPVQFSSALLSKSLQETSFYNFNRKYLGLIIDTLYERKYITDATGSSLQTQINFIHKLFANYILYPMLLIQNSYKLRGIEKYADKKCAADFLQESELRTFVQNWSWLLHDNTTAVLIHTKHGDKNCNVKEVMNIKNSNKKFIWMSLLIIAVGGYGFYTSNQNR